MNTGVEGGETAIKLARWGAGVGAVFGRKGTVSTRCGVGVFRCQ